MKKIENFRVVGITAFVLSVIAIGSCSSGHNEPLTTLPVTTLSIMEPPGIQGQSKKLVCGTFIQEITSTNTELNLPNRVPVIVASVDSNGSPLLLGLNRPGEFQIELSAQSTAESLVYCAPFLCPADNESANSFMTLIREEPTVRYLATLIENSKNWKLALAFDNTSPESAAFDKAVLAVARRMMNANLNSPVLQLAQYANVPTEFAGVKVSQEGDTQIVIENSKRHWLVVTGLPDAINWNLVASNPSFLSVSGAASSWRSSSTFDLGSNPPQDLRIYGWGMGQVAYYSAEAKSEDKRNLATSFALTIAFDGILRTSSSILGVVTDDWVKDTSLKLLLRIRSGGLLSTILNKLDRRDTNGAAEEVLKFALFFASEEILRPMADAAAESLISRVFDTVVHGFVAKAKLITDLAALAWDNAGNSFVIGVHTIGTGTTVPPPTPGPTDQELIQRAIYAEIPNSPPCSSFDIRGVWALATIPETNDAEGASVLLKKSSEDWKILDYGTSIESAGEAFGVPKEYWQDWGIGPNEAGYRPRRSDLIVGVEMALAHYLGSNFDESAMGAIDIQGKWALMPYGNQSPELWLFHMENSVQANGGPWRVIGNGSVEQIQQLMKSVGIPQAVRRAWGYD